ncbi:acetate--CoA ligase [Theileria parva strain Muguga]|uniref:Acetyl-coenzyme A synthetase n=1 Tax=Theileria parva TaxID=5875 RepID=Q4N2X3_THEPA|nr:acetate--CoA ligase [Theileria parva strain Muguga]EAN31571.1 acetate--CoA ligase [Theileria parva strain Muguga]|eukprot:XP_763854.1 acetyl-coenzyme A synthetase [Theileria parva strain Muguga]
MESNKRFSRFMLNRTSTDAANDDFEVVTSSYDVDSLYEPKPIPGHKFNITTFDQYERMYGESISNSDEFWGKIAKSSLHWISPYTKVSEGDFVDKNYAWFLNGKLNACYNCVDRWAEVRPDSLAIIYEGDEPEDQRKVTFNELKMNVCKVANVLKMLGARKGDCVTIYMPTIPELCYSVLACARIGAVHSVVFGGFSATSLAERIHDSNSHIVITADGGMRATKHIKTKDIMDDALTRCSFVTHCLVFRNIGSDVKMTPGRDVWMHEAMESVRPYCPVETMDSEDVLFILYTSGSTGKPKGLAHTTGGYLVYAYATVRYIFDSHEGDVFGCMADVGWITGHTYVVYGPLLNGITTVMFGSLPNYPTPDRYWNIVQEHGLTQFYTAPTAIRSLMKFGDEPLKGHNLSSLRVLGSVGEPINPEAWKWYYNVVGNGKVAVVDSYWQTETGGIIISPIPGVTFTKPGSATYPFFGIELAIIDANTGEELEGNNCSGLLCIKKPWPGMFRTIFGDHSRIHETYFPTKYPYYFTGDGAFRDKHGYIWISGRIDDTINVSGHRLCSAEIEYALTQVDIVSEAAVVGYPHALKGQGIFCFVSLKEASLRLPKEEVIGRLKMSIRHYVGPFATPDVVLITPNLPKTRSGKIMRRILRRLASKKFHDFGDVSTLANPEVVHQLIEDVKQVQ